MTFSTQVRRIRLLVVTVLCALALFVPGLTQSAVSAPAAAIRSATLKVGAETLTIEVVVNGRATRTLDGAIEVVVTLPARTTGKVVKVDRGFNEDGWSIEFRRGTNAGTGVVTVTVPARSKRTQLEIALSATSGWAVAVPSIANVATAIPIYV